MTQRGRTLKQGFTALFNTSKSDTIANVLIERVLRGQYRDTREIGGADEKGKDMVITGTLYLMPADENTQTMEPEVGAYVLRIEHEPRLIDYFTFKDEAGARAFMTARG